MTLPYHLLYVWYTMLGFFVFTIILVITVVKVVKKELEPLPQKTTGYVERTDDEIVAAWEKWMERLHEPDAKYLYCCSRLLSAREFVKAIKDGDKEIRDFAIGTSRKLAKLIEADPVEKILNSRP